MTGMIKPFTGAPTDQETSWDSIQWKKAQVEIRRLQMRIAKATREKRFGKVKALQRILTHSFYGKCLAVKKVTTNKGKNTPGISKKRGTKEGF